MNPHRTRRIGVATIAMLAIAAASVVPALAQSPSAAAPASSAGAGKTLAVITPDYAAQPAAKEAIDRFQAAAEARGYQVTLVDTASDNAAINGEITTAVAQDVDAIVTAFGTPQEFGEGLAAAGAAGVPVFGLDTGGVVEPTLVNVTTDNGFLGESSAQAIIDALGEPGQVAMIHFDPFEPVRLRAEAARALFEENGIEIIEYVQGDPADSTGFAKATTLDLLSKHPTGELDAVWAGWDASALGRLPGDPGGRPDRGPRDGRGRPGLRPAEVAKGGNWIATVRQDWPTIATTLADIIDAHFAGTDPAEPVVYVPAVLITAENAAQ